MLRYLLPAVAVFAAGCVPVYEPVGDIEKAEPDKGLIGKWTVKKSGGLAQMLDVKSFIVDIPEVKGNPKGLMRAITKFPGMDGDIWFYTAKIGKHNYATVIAGDSDPTKVTFLDEGSFAKWKEKSNKFFVFRYTRDGDTLTVDCGNYDKFTRLMQDTKINGDGSMYIEYFNTPAGWLEKYLVKNGPDKIFDGTNSMTLTREKK